MAAKSDLEWERYGGVDPYYGVLAEEQYSRRNLGQAELEKFFRTGTEHIEHVLGTVDSVFGGHNRARALDFGCGVGRLVIPLAGKFDRVAGLDISPSMLKEAKRNCEARGLGNVELLESDDGMTRLTGTFSFIHSFIVFQHILPRRGMPLFKRLLDALEPGGVGAIQFCYHIRLPAGMAWKRRILRTFPWLHLGLNVLKKRPLFYPLMEMNEYDCNAILAALQERGIRRVHLEYTDHGGHWGVMVYFRKEP